MQTPYDGMETVGKGEDGIMEQPVYICRRAGIDGSRILPLPASVWEDAEEVVLKQTANGSPPRLETWVKAIWNDWGMYVRYECEDDQLMASYVNRDDPIYQEDVVELFVSVDRRLEAYAEFEFSPKRVLFDGLVRNDLQGGIQVDTSWDCAGLDCHVDNRLRERRIVYEIAVPFAPLYDGAAPDSMLGQEWLGNFYRIDRSPEQGDEFTAWSPTIQVSFHTPQRFGRIVFAAERTD